MENYKDKADLLDWQHISDCLNETGYAHVPGFLADELCEALIEGYDNPDGYRKTVVMERHRFGLGQYKYWDYPLPPVIQALREALYPPLAVIANRWMKILNTGQEFPASLGELQTACHSHGQTKPTPLILKYGAGGFNTLHQDLYGEVYFPLQAAFFLNRPGVDYSGGEFVLTQQTPRAQSRAIVLTPGKGDMLIFTTRFRPVKGARGYYRAVMKHGVSEVREGRRHTMGMIFHDAAS
ncbi:2OG-Fe(II) oxygenase [Emcibacter sp.]|uniref:2OG-Fe(II) oxygenase n=1 Tax=Emcibacter sp. TaxID=1979954 RepID=UPI003A933F89